MDDVLDPFEPGEPEAGTPVTVEAVRDMVRGLIGGNIAGHDGRWSAEDPFWGGSRTPVGLFYSPTLDRSWRLIVVGGVGMGNLKLGQPVFPSSFTAGETMQLVEEFKGTVSYADLGIPWLAELGPNRQDLAVVVVAHAIVDAIADLS